MSEHDRTEMEAFIGFKAPQSFKEQLEAYAKQNGYTLSYVIRKAVEAEILAPDLKPQSELWLNFISWRKGVDTDMGGILQLVGELVEMQKGTAYFMEEITKSLKEVLVPAVAQNRENVKGLVDHVDGLQKSVFKEFRWQDERLNMIEGNLETVRRVLLVLLLDKHPEKGAEYIKTLEQSYKELAEKYPEKAEDLNRDLEAEKNYIKSLEAEKHE